MAIRPSHKLRLSWALYQKRKYQKMNEVSDKTHSNTTTIDVAGFQEFVDEFKNESDRAAVVLGAAKLDQLLYQVLQAYLMPVSGKSDELLDQSSALGTFSSRIEACYRIGLIEAKVARTLHLIRKIRNSFAHQVSGCTLTSGPQKDRISDLANEYLQYDDFIKFRNHFFGKTVDSSVNFRAVLALVAGRLESFRNRLSTLNNPNTLTMVHGNWKKTEV